MHTSSAIRLIMPSVIIVWMMITVDASSTHRPASPTSAAAASHPQPHVSFIEFDSSVKRTAPAAVDEGADASADEAPIPIQAHGSITPSDADSSISRKQAENVARNDPTTHLSYSDDQTEETHCVRTGVCTECGAEEKDAPYCTPSGAKEVVNCQVLAVSNITLSHLSAKEEEKQLLRTYTQFASCDLTGYGSNSFWAFQAFCLFSFGLSLWLLLKRRKVVLSLHHRRMDRLVNS